MPYSVPKLPAHRNRTMELAVLYRIFDILALPRLPRNTLPFIDVAEYTIPSFSF